MQLRYVHEALEGKHRKRADCLESCIKIASDELPACAGVAYLLGAGSQIVFGA